MNHRSLAGRQSLLRVFISDFDKFHHEALYKIIVQAAREQGLAGCTVFQASAGFGRGRVLHAGIEMEGAGERPLILELVDEPDRIRAFRGEIEPKLSGALVTEEKVHVHHYQAEGKEDTPSAHPVSEGEYMEARNLSGENTLLRIYVGESDKIGHHPLHLEILERARKQGLAGATAVHGVAGYGASSIVHTPHLFRLSSDLPVMIEIVDTSEHVHRFMAEIAPILQGALVTEEKVTVYHYSAKKAVPCP